MERMPTANESVITILRKLVDAYPDEFSYWNQSKLTERTEGATKGVFKHKHGAINHQISGALFGLKIANLFVERGILNTIQTKEIGSAILLHDADKVTDMQIIKLAQLPPNLNTWNEILKIINTSKIPDTKAIESSINIFREYFIKDSDEGDRVHIARSIIADELHKSKLIQFGFKAEIVDLQSCVEYTGCDDADKLIDQYQTSDSATKSRIVQKIIVSFVDNCLSESKIIDPKERAILVFKKPGNTALNIAYKKWNRNDETAEEKQIRVSEKEKKFISSLLDIKKEELIHTVKLQKPTKLE